MRQQKHANTCVSLFSVETPSATIQIVATYSGVVFDLQAEIVDTDGHTRRSHAVAKLSIDVAMRLETALQNAVAAAWGIEDPITEWSDPRQTALWPATDVVAPLRRRAAA